MNALAFGVAMLLLASSDIAVAQTACARSRTEAGPSFHLEPAPLKPQDSVVVASLCLATGKALGSYVATITYDSTKMRAVGVTPVGGMQVTNVRIAGVIRIAGAAPSGFANGLLASIVFIPSRPKTLETLTLSIGEASTPAGASIVAETKATGWKDKPGAVARPRADSILPRTAEVSRERVTDLVLYGKGFMPSGNTIIFGDAEVSGLASENHGTVIRFSAPTEFSRRGTGPVRRITPGLVDVRVRHPGGTSSAIAFIVKDDG